MVRGPLLYHRAGAEFTRGAWGLSCAAMSVTLTPAPASQAPLLQNLFQLYTHDFSEFWAGTARGELGPDGRFEAYPLDEYGYWRSPGCAAWFIHHEGALAGFALVNDHAHSGEATDANVAEFFVLRKHRGSGVGARAARALFAQRPGTWEVAVARKNLPALAFWRKTLAGSAGVSELRELDLRDDRWNGPVFRFRWAPDHAR